MIKRTLASALTALALTTGFQSSLTAGEVFPSKPIQIIVPWAPGGGSDISARIVADKASKYLGEAMIISNMTGAAGLNGAQKVVKSAPDGYTILWEHPGNLAVTPLVAKARYTWKDFDIIGSIGASPVAVFTRGSSPWSGIMDAVKDMKANPGKIRWATTPNGKRPRRQQRNLRSGFCRRISVHEIRRCQNSGHVFRGTQPARP